MGLFNPPGSSALAMHENIFFTPYQPRGKSQICKVVVSNNLQYSKWNLDLIVLVYFLSWRDSNSCQNTEINFRSSNFLVVLPNATKYKTGLDIKKILKSKTFLSSLRPRREQDYKDWSAVQFVTGLCSTCVQGWAQSPEPDRLATNFCLWATTKLIVFLKPKGWVPQISWLVAFGILVIHLRAQPWVC